MNQQAEAFLDARDTRANSEADSEAGSAQVHVSRPHESAQLHVSGRATYTDDIPLVARMSVSGA